MGCKWFAMDMPRMMRAKRERRWDPFEVWREVSCWCMDLMVVGLSRCCTCATWRMHERGSLVPCVLGNLVLWEMSCHIIGYIGSLCWHVAAVLLTSARAMHAQVEELRGKTMGIVG